MKTNIVIICSLIFVLFGCSPSLNDAKQNGFDSIEQMKAFQNAGFKSKNDLGALGFSDIEEYHFLTKKGYKQNMSLTKKKKN